jgi:hypothetical protein
MLTTETVVIHVKQGCVWDVWSPDANLKVLIIDSDSQELDENDKPVVSTFVHEWPDSQFDEETIKEVMGEELFKDLFEDA